MQAANLRAFLINALATAKAENVLFSVHLKATMMKVSDPIIFGHVVKAYFTDVFDKYGDDLAAAGLSANDGLGAILAGLPSLPNGEEIKAAFERRPGGGPPAVLRQLRQGDHQPARAERRHRGRLPAGPDPQRRQAVGGRRRRGRHPRGHPRLLLAGVYATVIEDVKRNGPLDPATIGTVPNVGLMAQAAEEYGSHNKTFEIPATAPSPSSTRPARSPLAHDVEAGDIWRACQTKDIPVRDWVKLAVTRARASQTPAIFWLDESRATTPS